MKLFFAEGSAFFDPKTFEYEGKDLWLFASERHTHSASALQSLHRLGFKTSGTDSHGWNCLFMSIMNSCDPSTSDDFERLQFLLSVFDDVYAQDFKGCTIFDLVNDDTCSPGSYRRDLWYCTLERAGIDISHRVVDQASIAVHSAALGNCKYTPEHYHALKHLRSWDPSNFRSQMDRLLQEIPLDEDESREMERILELEFKTEEESSD
jgi:hypothetical protein